MTDPSDIQGRGVLDRAAFRTAAHLNTVFPEGTDVTVRRGWSG